MNSIARGVLLAMFVAAVMFVIIAAAGQKETQITTLALGFGILFFGIAGIIAAILRK